MTYDYYGPWSRYTGQNSALFASSIESDWEKGNLNVAASAQNWLNAGAHRNKMAIGVAFYGRTFNLIDPNQHGLHSPYKGVGPDGGSPAYSVVSKKKRVEYSFTLTDKILIQTSHQNIILILILRFAQSIMAGLEYGMTNKRTPIDIRETVG